MTTASIPKLPAPGGSHSGALRQQEHCHLVLHAAVAGHAGVVSVDGINGVIDGFHSDPSLHDFWKYIMPAAANQSFFVSSFKHTRPTYVQKGQVCSYTDPKFNLSGVIPLWENKF